MKLLLFVFLGALYNKDAESKCGTLLMCPTFCMKIHGGCYVCDCGMFSDYLHQASDNMVDKSNTQEQQTGTRLSTYTSGYGLSQNENEIFTTNNDQRVQGVKDMMELGRQFMNAHSHPLVRQDEGHGRPSYTYYGDNYGNMPGMNCVPVDTKCPSSCWNTDVFTGCIHCACDDRLQINENIQSSSKILENHTPSTVHFEKYNDFGGKSSPTTISTVEQTQMTTGKDKPSKHPVSTTITNNLLYPYPFKIPTKTPIHRVQAEEKTSTETVTKMPDEDITIKRIGHLISALSLPAKTRSFAVPTPPSSSNRKMSFFETNTNSTGIQGTLPSYIDYPSSVLIPQIGLYSVQQSPSNETLNLGLGGRMSQQLFKETLPQDFTNLSIAIDHLGANTGNVKMNTQNRKEQLDSSGTSEPLLTPLNTTTENNYLTTENDIQQNLVNRSMPYISHDINLTSNSSSKGVINYMGFYGHFKSG